MEKQSSASFASLESIKNPANSMILEDRLRILRKIEGLKLQTIDHGDCILEIEIKPRLEINFERILKRGDISDHERRGLSKLAVKAKYFIRAAINISQIQDLENELSPSSLSRTIVIFNGVDPNFYRGNRENTFAAAIWTRAEGISKYLGEISSMFEIMLHGEKVEKAKYLQLKEIFIQERKKVENLEQEVKKERKKREKERKRMEDLEQKYQELELRRREERKARKRAQKQLEEERKKNENLEKKLKEQELKQREEQLRIDRELEEQKKFENEATLKFHK